MATMADVDELARAMPETVVERADDGRPEYSVRGKTFCLHRSRRRDAVDEATGERLGDVLLFRVPDLDVKDARLADDRGIYFTTPHFKGYAAVLVRIGALDRLDRAELRDLIVDAWLTRAPRRLAGTWLAENADPG